MAVNIPALVIGIIIALLVIKKFMSSGLDSKWVYAILLATLPAYYWVFALYANNYNALVNEAFIGLVFIIIAGLSFGKSKLLGLVILGIGYIAHAAYDIAHTSVTPHHIAPNWWPEFCGSIDGIIGIYLLWLSYNRMTLDKQAAH